MWKKIHNFLIIILSKIKYVISVKIIKYIVPINYMALINIKEFKLNF